jgi:hypothetical protein
MPSAKPAEPFATIPLVVDTSGPPGSASDPAVRPRRDALRAGLLAF